MATSETFQVGDRVVSDENVRLGVGLVTGTTNYGENVYVRWGKGERSLLCDRSVLTKCAMPVVGNAIEYDTVNAQAVPVRRVEPQSFTELGDWRRAGSGWTRDGNDGGAHVADQSEPGVFRVVACGTLLAQRFACPDAARASADAYLVSQGRLDKSRAFVRLGEWEQRRDAHAIAPRTLWCRTSAASVTVRRNADGTLTVEDAAFYPPAVGHTVRMNRPVTDQTTVTLANWERCLPHLLSAAPREFRDGFNRKQGPAWEAYLVALAGELQACPDGVWPARPLGW